MPAPDRVAVHPSGVALRLAVKADRPSLQRFACWADGDPDFVRHVQSTIRTSGWKATASQRAVVFVLDGVIVGTARHHHATDGDDRGFRWVEWLALDISWHGQVTGTEERMSDVVSRMLLDDCRLVAALSGELVIGCRIHRDNVRSRRVSQRCGWIEAAGLTPDPADHVTWIAPIEP